MFSGYTMDWKPYNIGGFCNTIEIWKLKHGLEIKEISCNLFKFQLFH